MMNWKICAGLALIGVTVASAASAQSRRASGSVKIDGSSTVYPIMAATAELLRSEQPRINVTVGVSGTGGGFKKFFEERAALRTDVSNASRPISTSEIELARRRGVEFVELPIALDGLAVCVHPSASFVDHLTLDELRRIWEPGSEIQNWSQVRAGFPDLPLKLFAPGTDSGTFDYFAEAVVGQRRTRSDYAANENDNVLVMGVKNEPGALGYFGYAYYHANADGLKLLAIDPGDGRPVLPTIETIRDGRYRPLSRPLFVYVNSESAVKPAVREFFEFFFRKAPQIVEHPKVGYVSLSPELHQAAWKRLDQVITGSVMQDEGAQRNLAEAFGAK